MSWRPGIVKEGGFYSPANNHGQYVVSAYRACCWGVPLIFAKHFGSVSTPLCAAAGGFVLLSALYYLYAAKHEVDTEAQDAPQRFQAS